MTLCAIASRSSPGPARHRPRHRARPGRRPAPTSPPSTSTGGVSEETAAAVAAQVAKPRPRDRHGQRVATSTAWWPRRSPPSARSTFSSTMRASPVAPTSWISPRPDWDRIMRVNAKGVFFCLQRVAREMIPRRSGAHHQHRLDRRQGLRRHLQRHLRRQQGRRHQPDQDGRAAARPHNINVNAICPGIMRTALSDDLVATRAQKEGVSSRRCARRNARASPSSAPTSPRTSPPGGIPGLARRAEHHRSVLQRRRRHHLRLASEGSSPSRTATPARPLSSAISGLTG